MFVYQSGSLFQAFSLWGAAKGECGHERENEGDLGKNAGEGEGFVPLLAPNPSPFFHLFFMPAPQLLTEHLEQAASLVTRVSSTHNMNLSY